MQEDATKYFSTLGSGRVFASELHGESVVSAFVILARKIGLYKSYTAEL